jgi:hypothetical protein
LQRLATKRSTLTKTTSQFCGTGSLGDIGGPLEAKRTLDSCTTGPGG